MENDTGLDPAYSLLEVSNSRMDFSSHLERVCNTHAAHACTLTDTYTLFYILYTPSRINRRIFTEVWVFMPNQLQWRLNSMHNSSLLELAAYV